MATKIKSITAITHTYSTGELYRGLLLDRIEDKTIEYSDALVTIYIGYTKDEEPVFELINTPVDVEYERASAPEG